MEANFRVGDWEVYPTLNRLQRGAEVQRIEPKVMDLLVYLARHSGEVQSRERLLQAVWPDAFVTDQVLTNAIAEIRKVFDDDPAAPAFIQTVPRRGYVLIATVVQDVGNTGIEVQEERQIAVSFARKKVKVITLGLAAIVATAGLLWFLVSSWTANEVPKVPNSVIVVAFENQTGDRRFDHLRKVIPDLLITSLENTSRFQVTTWERMQDLLRQSGRRDVSLIDAESGFELCRREGVRAVVTGSVTKAGNTFVTNLKVLDGESRRMLSSATSRGEGENSIIRTQIDELTAEITRGLISAAALKESPAVRVMDVTTDSMDAYAAFVRGREAWGHVSYDQARRELERALELDPEFAMALVYLGQVYGGLHDIDARDRHLKRASVLAGKLPEKERLLVQACNAWIVNGDMEDGKEVLEELTAKYPNEKRYTWELGHLYDSLKLPHDALRHYLRALELDPDYGLALNSTAYVYMDLERYDEARDYLRKYAALNPDEANPIDSLAELEFRGGRLEEAVANYRRVVVMDPKFGGDLKLSIVQGVREDYGTALQNADLWVDRAPSEAFQAQGYALKSIILQLTGRVRQSREALKAAKELMTTVGLSHFTYYIEGWLELDELDFAKSHAAFRRGREARQKRDGDRSTDQLRWSLCEAFVAAAEGDSAAARAAFSSAEKILMTLTPDQRRFYSSSEHLVRARILTAEGDGDAALATLARNWPGPHPGLDAAPYISYCFPLASDDLARMYAAKKNWDRAITEYKVLTVIGPQHRNRRLIHPIYHYRLAQIYEKKGQMSEAATEYERFLKLWEKADQRRPEVRDARSRLAVLRGR